jgi:hypothetical protein
MKLGMMLAAALTLAVSAPGAWAFDPVHEVTWGKRIEVASGDAYQGPWRMNDSAFHYVDDPTVAINEAGVVAVAWADQSRQDIFFQLYAPDGEKRFEAPVNVSRTPQLFLASADGHYLQRSERGVYPLAGDRLFRGHAWRRDLFRALHRRRQDLQ